MVWFQELKLCSKEVEKPAVIFVGLGRSLRRPAEMEREVVTM